MARYIDADELLNNLPDDLPYKASVKRVLIQAPTADVVPKSEVERLRFNLEAVLEEIPETKREVAREIFEDMQSCLIQRHWNGLDIVSFEFDAVKYAELKKKYTKEGEDKE